MTDQFIPQDVVLAVQQFALSVGALPVYLGQKLGDHGRFDVGGDP